MRDRIHPAFAALRVTSKAEWAAQQIVEGCAWARWRTRSPIHGRDSRIWSLNPQRAEPLHEITKGDGTFTHNNDDHLSSTLPMFPGTTLAVVPYFNEGRHRGAARAAGTIGSRIRRLESCSMVDSKKLDELRRIDRALADGEARIKKQREVVSRFQLLNRGSPRAEAILDAMLLAQSEREHYREMLLARLTDGDPPKPE